MEIAAERLRRFSLSSAFASAAARVSQLLKVKPSSLPLPLIGRENLIGFLSISMQEAYSEGFTARIVGPAAERQTIRFAQRRTCVLLHQSAAAARSLTPIRTTC
jgi:hypothetical protein